MEEKISSGRLHRLVLSDRHTGSVTGVNDVVSFDENEIVLDTEMGLLTVRGKELHVKRLTLEKGELDLEGQFQCSTEKVGRILLLTVIKIKREQIISVRIHVDNEIGAFELRD